MTKPPFQFTIARLLCATASFAAILAVLMALGSHSGPMASFGPPSWFLAGTKLLSIVMLTSLFGATFGVLWKGEEGLVMGIFGGVIGSVLVAPILFI